MGNGVVLVVAREYDHMVLQYIMQVCSISLSICCQSTNCIFTYRAKLAYC